MKQGSNKLVTNHFDNVEVITSKTGLIQRLKLYYQGSKEAVKADYQLFDTTPTSFLISSSQDSAQFDEFKERFSQIESG